MTRQIAEFIRRYPFLIRIPYYLYRFLQSRYTLGVVGVIINDDKQVLIVEHVFHPENPWGLPGGWIGRNEEPALAVVRELEEELQIIAQVQDIIHVEKSKNNHIDMAFLCEPSNGIGKLSNELLDYQWVDLAKLPKLNPFHQKVIEIAFDKFHRS